MVILGAKGDGGLIKMGLIKILNVRQRGEGVTEIKQVRRRKEEWGPNFGHFVRT